MWDQVKQALNESTARFLTAVATLLPGVVVLIVALLFSCFVAWLMAGLVRRLLVSMEFDARVGRWEYPGLADWSPRKSPTLLISRTIAFVIVLTGLLIGIAALHTQLTDALASRVFNYLPNLLGAGLVLLVGTVIARYLARSVLIGAVNMNLRYGRLLSVGVKWMLIVLTAAMALAHLKIAPGIVELAFGILFGGIVLALALAVGLGSKDLVSKSLENDAKKPANETIEEPLRHI